MNLDNLRNALAALVADLRRRHLLPAVGLLIVAAIAIPLALSQSGTASNVPSAGPLPAVTTPTVNVNSSKTHSEPANDYLTGPAHDPFIQPRTTTSSSATTTTSAGTTTTASSGTVSSSGGSQTVTRVITVTNPTKTSGTTSTTPAPVYTAYRVTVEFGQAGGSLKTYRNLRRFATLPSSKAPVLAYLGVERDGTTAVFVVASSTTAAGEGQCSPSASKCTYLAMQPGEEVLLLSQTSGGGSSEYQMKYVSVQKVTSTKAIPDQKSAVGWRLMVWAARFMPAIRTMFFSERTGAVTIHLGRTVKATSRMAIAQETSSGSG